MSIIFSFLFTFFIPSVYGYTCAVSQTTDTHKICQIFRNTNIETLSTGINFNDDDYCQYNSTYIGCSNARISAIKLERIHLKGTLDLSVGWPNNLALIDVEQFSNETALSGNWDWSSVQNLNQLTKIDLDYNQFNSTLTNTDWNIIAAMSSLTDLCLAGNNFESNFSQVTINNVSGIKYLKLSYNNFYGTMDVSTTGFISNFPQLISFQLHSTNIAGHFDNLDIFSSAYVSNLDEIHFENNHFSGELRMSTGHEFTAGFRFFEIDYNEFYGDVDWNIFSGLYGLEVLDMNDNALTGQIDWLIISDLATNGVLYKIHLKNNSFTGYADFSWMPAAGIDFSLDVDIHCDPVQYPCIGGVHIDRNQTYCYSKSECEATCRCAVTNQPTSKPTILLQPINNATRSSSRGIFMTVLRDSSFSMILIGIVVALLCIICGCAVFVIFLIHNHYKRKVLTHNGDIKKHQALANIQNEGEDTVTHTIPLDDRIEGLKNFPSTSLPQIPDSMTTKVNAPALLDINSTTDMESMYGSVPRVTSGFLPISPNATTQQTHVQQQLKSPTHNNIFNGNYRSAGLPKVKTNALNEDHEYEYYYEDEFEASANADEYEYYYEEEHEEKKHSDIHCTTEMIYVQYMEKFGYPPKQAGHLQKFAKETNKSISWKDASNMIKNPPPINVSQ